MPKGWAKIWVIMKGSQSSVGIETSLEMADGRLSELQLKLWTAQASQCTSG